MAPRANERGPLNPVDVAGEVAAAVAVLARHRVGAVILVAPSAAVEGGVVLNAVVNRELLVAIFTPEYVNRLHRGAVIVRGGRIERAGVPVTWAEVLGRAAELAAGVAILVDEDDGEIRVAARTGRGEVVDAQTLDGLLQKFAVDKLSA